MIFFSIEK